MKKNLFSFFGLVLAISLSAFTAPSTPASKTSASYYWYEVDLQNNVIPQGAQHFALAEDVPSLCPESAEEVDCIRGFAQNMDAQFSTAPSTLRGEVQKLTDNPNE